MSVWPVFTDEIQPAGYPDPIKGSSQVSFSEPEKESSHYARTAIVLRISSIRGFVSPPDKHPQSAATSLCSSGRLETTGVFSLCTSEKRQTSYPSVGKWLTETLLLVETNASKPVGCMALINLMHNSIFWQICMKFYWGKKWLPIHDLQCNCGNTSTPLEIDITT